MIEKRLFNGYWSLPNSAVNTPGLLTYDPLEKSVLDLIGELENGNSYDVLLMESAIHGFSVDGKHLTLFNNVHNGSSLSFPGIPTVSYRPTYIVVGEHLSNIDDAIYTEIEVEIEPLTQWIDTWGFSYSERDKTHFTLNYNLPQNILFEIDEKVSGVIEFHGNLTKGLKESLTGSHKAKLIIKANESLSLTTLLDYVWHFKKFLTFATLDDTYLKAIHLTIANDTEFVRNKVKQVELLYFQRDLKLRVKENHRSYFLFTYPDIQEYFQSIIKKWYSKKDVMQPIVDIEYENLSKRQMFLETAFLSSVQALETYHRRLRQDTGALIGDHEQRLNIILLNLEPSQQDFIKGKLKYAYEPSLMQRLKSLIEEFDISTIKKLLGTKQQTKSFIFKVVNARNYYTHYDLQLKNDIPDHKELAIINQKLRALLLVAILAELGFDKSTIERMLGDIEVYRYNFLLRN